MNIDHNFSWKEINKTNLSLTNELLSIALENKLFWINLMILNLDYKIPQPSIAEFVLIDGGPILNRPNDSLYCKNIFVAPFTTTKIEKIIPLKWQPFPKDKIDFIASKINNNREYYFHKFKELYKLTTGPFEEYTNYRNRNQEYVLKKDPYNSFLDLGKDSSTINHIISLMRLSNKNINEIIKDLFDD
jgi:hypothetical protein